MSMYVFNECVVTVWKVTDIQTDRHTTFKPQSNGIWHISVAQRNTDFKAN